MKKQGPPPCGMKREGMELLMYPIMGVTMAANKGIIVSQNRMSGKAGGTADI
jgi:hypothetical protein